MYLNIPIRIEGVFLDSPQQVTSPLADFSKLPWNDGTQDFNFSQPFVGDGIVRQPFGSQNLMLGKGLHLHFIIPHFLGQHVPKVPGLADTQQLPNVGKLPAAPNRWLITRTDKDGTKKQWIIDSDFIHMDESYVPQEPTCIIPFPKGRPFRYMGLKTTQGQSNLTLENLAAPNTRQTGSYFKQLNNNQGLSVIGFGDSSVNLRAWVWTANPNDAYDLHFDLNRSVKLAFDRNGIEIPFPYRTVILRNEEKGSTSTGPAAQTEA